MKYFSKALTIFIITAILITAFTGCSSAPKTELGNCNSAKAVFKYGDSDISADLSVEEFISVLKILNGKKMHDDKPSCAFTENVSVIMNGTEVFCIACDTCPMVYYENKQMYISLTDEENEKLRDILTNYGFVFPCV